MDDKKMSHEQADEIRKETGSVGPHPDETQEGRQQNPMDDHAPEDIDSSATGAGPSGGGA
jgi:hypothetical protein